VKTSLTQQGALNVPWVSFDRASEATCRDGIRRLKMPPPKKTKAPAAAAPAAPTAQAAAPTAAPQRAEAPQRSEVKGSGTGGATATAAPKEVTWQSIERRAYEIYANRGYAAGDQNADWYEAERQLKAGL
jgi:hypothetical protein